jgi:hypothetical protein
MNMKTIALFVVLSLAVVTALSTITTRVARAQSADWILYVSVNNVAFGEPTIGISVKGPYAYHDYQSIPNWPSPSTTFTIPGNAVPPGASFEVCAGTGIIGALLPHCTFYTYGGAGSAAVTVTP